MHSRIVLTLALLGGASACYDWDEHAPVLGPAAATGDGPTGDGGAPSDATPSPDPEDPADPSPTSGAGAAGGSGASSASSSSTTAGVGVGGGGQNGACDLGGTCDECIACAVEGACQAQADACAQELECVAFYDCASGCVDELCLAECDDFYPGGSALFQDAAVCVVCGECTGSCADFGDLLGCI